MSGSTPSGVETASRPLLILVNTPIILSFHYQLQRNRSRYIAVTVHRRVSQRISACLIRTVVTVDLNLTEQSRTIICIIRDFRYLRNRIKRIADLDLYLFLF